VLWPATADQSAGYSRTIRSAGNRLSLPHLLEKERGTRVAALIAQITRPVRFHVPSILRTCLAADNDPIDTTPKPGPKIKGLKQRRDGRGRAGGLKFAAAPPSCFRRRTKPVMRPSLRPQSDGSILRTFCGRLVRISQSRLRHWRMMFRASVRHSSATWLSWKSPRDMQKTRRRSPAAAALRSHRYGARRLLRWCADVGRPTLRGHTAHPPALRRSSDHMQG
jgi:hypothetical protein